MTLGEIIKEYAEEHSMTQFIKDSGLSKAYVYMLINNKNKNGEPIEPSIETIKKVATGVHSTFDAVFNRLDYGFEVRRKDDKPSVMRFQDLDIELHSISDQSARLTKYFVLLEALLNNKDVEKLLEVAKESNSEDLKMATDLLLRFNRRDRGST